MPPVTQAAPLAQRSRGMRDLLPDDMRAFRRVEDAFRAAASRWGYEEIRTPTIENYSLFTAAGALTPQMLSRVYSFLDWDGWSGERVVLRPDSTIPVARAASEGSVPLPARVCYVQNVFRFHESEDREEWQCGLEYLGAPPSLGDLEVAAVGCETLEALGLRPTVRVGHVGVSRAIANAVAAHEDERRALLDRVTEEGLGGMRREAARIPGLGAFVEAALQPAASPTLVANLKGLAVGVLPAAVGALEETEGVAGALAESGRAVVVDFGMPRDFEYYTGVVFEFHAGGAGWGSGGRYTPAGTDAPATACGLGLSLDRLARHVRSSTRRRTSVAVIPESPDQMARAIAAARALHRGGIAAVLAVAWADEPLAVRVGSDRLTARTPDGEHQMKTLDDVVGLLVQYK
jgi:histidyl-tRNA synthetase